MHVSRKHSDEIMKVMNQTITQVAYAGEVCIESL